MLLDLYVARLKGARVSVSSLCVAANIPPTTALRHIADLVENGEIDRTPDPADQRRAFLELSDAAFARINEWIDHCL
ncbi:MULTISPECIES: winged helix DNA-binding protein [Sphingomonas]|uniref:Winged helix DNA-binding protein n=2 Tax=Sphingomonas paucimobilis TaxID=13689 RepID=A0A7Y2PAV0_SPHPI|nr:winged helix DNA-binding protein [Sphingomonas paucimobilis]NNG56016.1 winged helix DNA-binding protein [Sphingomonas paucimobilis]